jgi:hypothetical protein
MANYNVTLLVTVGKGSSAVFSHNGSATGTGTNSSNPLEVDGGDTVTFIRSTSSAGRARFHDLSIFTDNSNIVINTGEANVTRTVASGGTTADTITGLNQGEGASDSFFFERQATASDTTPNAFSFTDVTNAARNTYFYAFVQISGIDAAATASGSSGGTYGFAVSSSTTQPSESSFTTANKSITNGQYLHVRVLSSSSFSTAVGATITVGGVSDTFTVTTAADTTPTFTLTAPTSINEGSAGTCTVTTTNVSNGTTLYWSVTPEDDFSTDEGTVSISGNSGSFSVTPTADSSTEGAETGTVVLWSNPARTTQVAIDTFVINDTSTGSGAGSTASGTGGSSTYGISLKSTTTSATEVFGVNLRATNIQVFSTGVIAGNGGTRVHTNLGSDVTDTAKVQVIVDAGWFSSSGHFPVTRSTANGGQVTITNNRSSNVTVTSLIIRSA